MPGCTNPNPTFRTLHARRIPEILSGIVEDGGSPRSPPEVVPEAMTGWRSLRSSNQDDLPKKPDEMRAFGRSRMRVLRGLIVGLRRMADDTGRPYRSDGKRGRTLQAVTLLDLSRRGRRRFLRVGSPVANDRDDNGVLPPSASRSPVVCYADLDFDRPSDQQIPGER